MCLKLSKKNCMLCSKCNLTCISGCKKFLDMRKFAKTLNANSVTPEQLDEMRKATECFHSIVDTMEVEESGYVIEDCPFTSQVAICAGCQELLINENHPATKLMIDHYHVFEKVGAYSLQWVRK